MNTICIYLLLPNSFQLSCLVMINRRHISFGVQVEHFPEYSSFMEIMFLLYYYSVEFGQTRSPSPTAKTISVYLIGGHLDCFSKLLNGLFPTCIWFSLRSTQSPLILFSISPTSRTTMASDCLSIQIQISHYFYITPL